MTPDRPAAIRSARRLARWALGGALLISSALALAQRGPESLLPPGFDASPAARPSRAPRPAAPPRAEAPQVEPSIAATPVIEALPTGAASTAVGTGKSALPPGITSFDDLLRLPPDQLDQLLGLRPKYDIPPGAARAMLDVGVIGTGEGGLPPFSLAHQDASLVRALLAGNSGRMVSRWGHILLRRALASRLDAPAGMDPAEFAALRAALLNRMGEGEAARALVQDVDPANYSPELIQAAFDAYVATEDLTGLCPVVGVAGDSRNDPPWQVLKGICATFSANGAAGLAQIDHLTKTAAMPSIDMLLAQKYAGAAGVSGQGGGRRAVKIEWEGVSDMTPWRHALALATGLTPPPALMQNAGPAYAEAEATAPMLGLGARSDAADRAAGEGVLSSLAMVDLYSQIYANDDITGGPADRALQLHDAYLAESPDDRLKAMRALWDGAGDSQSRYSRQVLTAYAAARMPVTSDMSAAGGDLIASMLCAGLDANVARWRPVLDVGSPGWALLILSAPAGGTADSGGIDRFVKDDSSSDQRKSAFLAAGLAGLGRIGQSEQRDLSGRLSAHLESQTRWTRLIDQAAQAGNPTLVALLAGLGMQGESWDKMTPRFLYHIVLDLNRVGLSAEARMIAAEAVARG